MAANLKYTKYQYGEEHELQNLGVWEVDIADKTKTWIIWLHGGAWRDPRITHLAFSATVDALCAQRSASASASASTADSEADDPLSGVGGLASLDYRLSPHADFAQDAGSTPARSLRAARHPDHLDDVRAGVAFLQRRFGFGGNYVLMGHSAGATLALQLLTAPEKEKDGKEEGNGEVVKVELPRAVVGLAGVYDMTGLVDRRGPGYAPFMAAAFGDDRAGWDAAAPATYGGSYNDAWRRSSSSSSSSGGGSEGGGLVVHLGWSPEDMMIDEPEVDAMAAKLRADGGVALKVHKDLRGNHNVVWEQGTDVARLVREVLADLAKRQQQS
ncbi:alpha/beta-hydrolase [Xylariaceae sp. FL0804]|nr:alpha/beta-hydrolase [Xylariaceae sp. FL0804]